MNTKPHSFKLYGDFLQNGKRSTDGFFELLYEKNTKLDYKSGYGAKGTYQQARIASSDYEPDYRKVTYKFKP